MTIVVDASICAGWFLPDEQTEAATQIGRQVATEGARVPDLYWHEMRNLLVLAMRRGRLPEDMLLLQLAKLEKLPIRSAGAGDTVQVTQLAVKHGLTAYDAAYLALTISEHLPLATFDKALRRAALAEGVIVLPAELPI